MTFDLSKTPSVSVDRPVAYEEPIRTDAFRGGYYVLRVGAEDPQQPHAEDELYLVIRGKASFEMAGERRPVHEGLVIVVPAGVAHRFVDIEEDLTLFVLFAKGPRSAPIEPR